MTPAGWTRWPGKPAGWPWRPTCAPGGPASLAESALKLARSLPEAAGPAPGVDILINNAGVGWCGPVGDMAAGQVSEILAVNLAAPIELTRLLLPGMTARGRGRVVFVSSIVGDTAVRGETVYSAAKAGLGYFAESLAYELEGSGVGVSVVVPGVINTPFFDRRGQPYGRRRPEPLPAERAAETVQLALEHDRQVVYVPRWLSFPARLHGAAPRTFGLLAHWFGMHG